MRGAGADAWGGTVSRTTTALLLRCHMTCLLLGCPVGAQALTHGVVWAMSRTTFRGIVLAGRVQKRARYEEVLGDMEIFHSLSAANRSSIADCLTSEVYQVCCFMQQT